MKSLSLGSVALTVFISIVSGWIERAPALKLADDPPEKATSAQDPFAVPDGGVDRLLKFVEDLKKKPLRPKAATPEAIAEFIEQKNKLGKAIIKACDKILALNPTDEQAAQAVKDKLNALLQMQSFGDKEAADKRAETVKSLENDKRPAIQKMVKRYQLRSEALSWDQNAEAAKREAFLKQFTDHLQNGELDADAGNFAMQFGQALVQSGDKELAADAYEVAAKIFAATNDMALRLQFGAMDGRARWLRLVGNPMKLNGTLLDGKKFDWAPYQGKVVLVDFWATWCKPCVAEIPNVKKNYERYHDQGFDVVGISLDFKREPLDQFIKDNKIPWANLYDGFMAFSPIARYYGITGIPQAVLIGRDGKVIATDARGEKLTQYLEKLFDEAKGKKAEAKEDTAETAAN